MKCSVAMTMCFFILSAILDGCITNSKENMKDKQQQFAVTKSEKEWREILTPEQYRVLRKKGTEPAFTGKYYDNTSFSLIEIKGS